MDVSDMEPSPLHFLSLYYSFHLLSLSSLSIAIQVMWQVIYADLPVIYAVNCPCHGSPYEPYLAN